MAWTRPQLISLLVLLGVASYTHLKNLGDAYLWEDEAQTALVARTVLSRGTPYGTDGRNFFSAELGAEYGKDHLWQWHMWLPFYAVAGTYAVLGESTFSSRLPFALAGIISVLLVFFFLHEQGALGPALVSSLVLSLYVPFLILNRQCRYYSFLTLFTVAALYFYQRWCRERKRIQAILLGIALSLLFHTHYLHCAAVAAPILLDWVVWDRKSGRQVLWALGIFAILCVPWVPFILGIRYGSAYGGQMGWVHFWEEWTGYFRYVRRYIVPWPLFLGLICAMGGGAYRRESALLVGVGMLTLLGLSITSPAPFFRYLAPEMALAAILLGLVLNGVFGKGRWALSCLVVVLVLSRADTRGFWGEIHNDYRGPVRAIVELLRREAKTTDRVVITYDDLPVKFYTPLRVFGGLTGEDLSKARGAEWVIPRHTTVCDKDQKVKDFINANFDLSRYEKITLPATDTMTENREEPALHLFRSPEGEPRVVVYRKR
ncbi:MAG: glycosyltransferase family 39 protein [Deltaproteobacteria bacterium]|nr:glycosyltransferase family 39 protein [Deltaproteobacteria bacterium]MBI3294382.1 glycosyltransferase family 39 protein [Deltaproteobacteria bacterium]